MGVANLIRIQAFLEVQEETLKAMQERESDLEMTQEMALNDALRYNQEMQNEAKIMEQKLFEEAR